MAAGCTAARPPPRRGSAGRRTPAGATSPPRGCRPRCYPPRPRVSWPRRPRCGAQPREELVVGDVLHQIRVDVRTAGDVATLVEQVPVPAVAAVQQFPPVPVEVLDVEGVDAVLLHDLVDAAESVLVLDLPQRLVRVVDLVPAGHVDAVVVEQTHR